MDDVPVYGWVKTVPVISLIFSSAITPGIPCHWSAASLGIKHPHTSADTPIILNGGRP